MSNGEKLVNSYLKAHNYKFKYGIVCLFLNNLHADFLIHLRNHIMIIEYDGSQHFKPKNLWGGLDKLKYIRKTDREKNLLCIRHHVFLLRLEDMCDLASKNTKKAKLKINYILSKILPSKNKQGIDLRFISYDKDNQLNLREQDFKVEQIILINTIHNPKLLNKVNINDFYFIENSDICGVMKNLIKSNSKITLKHLKSGLENRHEIHSQDEVEYLVTLFKKPYNRVKPITYYLIKLKKQAERRAIHGKPYPCGRLTF